MVGSRVRRPSPATHASVCGTCLPSRTVPCVPTKPIRHCGDSPSPSRSRRWSGPGVSGPRHEFPGAAQQCAGPHPPAWSGTRPKQLASTPRIPVIARLLFGVPFGAQADRQMSAWLWSVSLAESYM